MAFGLFRKRPPEPAAPAIAPQPNSAIAADASATSDSDSAKQILELLEIELGAMIRQLERAAQSVAGGAEATATHALDHSPAHRRLDQPHQRGAIDRHHLLAGRR